MSIEKTISLMGETGRVSVEKHGCEKCGRGVDRVVFREGDFGTKQLLTGETAAAVWDLIQSSMIGRIR